MAEKIEDRPAGIESHGIEINKHHIHYLRAGSGPPVVLVHGGASDSSDWVKTMVALFRQYSLYAPDLLGFGRSERNDHGYYLSDFTESILGFIDELGLEQPSLVGHSFGARLCLDIALQHPEKVRKLVLVDAAGLGNISRLGNIVLTGFWALRKLLRRPQPHPQFLYREGEDPLWLCVDQLPDLKTPTLLIWKRYDIYLPLDIARRAVKMIPDARLEVVPGYGHAPHGANNEAFNRLLLDFLDHD
jgi:pimeloyl-ACP methyl ester carboxylesterase